MINLRNLIVKILGEEIANNWYVKLKYFRINFDLFKKGPSQAKKRWLQSKPRKELTWGLEIKGDNFIQKISKKQIFNANSDILEIGPGLGRLLTSIIKKKLSFKSYLGLDISPSNVEYLQATFKNPKIEFEVGNPEIVTLEKQFDAVFSSLTFKHFMPSFERALCNISKYSKNNGMIFFDLDEDTSDGIPEDAYTGQYTKKEITKILTLCNLDLTEFDEIEHTKGRKGLLVAAKKHA